MGRKTISRRDVLGVIGKTGAALGAGACFFLSLKTSPLEGAAKEAPVAGTGPAQLSRQKIAVQAAEKVVISGAGSKLTVKISGPSGRHFAVAYATADVREQYKAMAGARGYIGENGLGTVEADVKTLPSGKVFLRVVTGKTGAFDDDIAGTEAFVVQISKGAIAGYEGVLSRPLLSAKAGQVAVASFAAACWSAKKR